jgi:hypothetical protein
MIPECSEDNESNGMNIDASWDNSENELKLKETPNFF